MRKRALAVARSAGLTRGRRGRATRDRGQALVEVLVGAIALVPLLLLVAWLGKVQSIRHSTVAASRTLAFECTVRPDECADAGALAALAGEVRRRAFTRVDAPILSAESIADDPPRDERNPLWVDRGGRPLLERMGDVGVRVERQRFDAGQSLAQSRGTGIVADSVALLAERAGPGRFGLDIGDGLVAARVQVAVSPRAPKSFATQLDSIPLRVHARTAVLTDAWNASRPIGGEPRSVESRVAQGKQVLAAWEGTVDARYLPTRGFIGLMGAIGLEPEAGAFRYHEADVDVVPRDRTPGQGPEQRSLAERRGVGQPTWDAP